MCSIKEYICSSTSEDREYSTLRQLKSRSILFSAVKSKNLKNVLALALLLLLAVGLARQVLSEGISGTVTGYLVDKNGEPIVGARVEAWQGSLLITTTETDSVGHFMLELDAGTYTLKFLKKGYETKTVSVKVSAREINSLGTITLGYAVQLTVVYKHIKVAPGSTVTIPVQLENKGEYSEEASIEIEGPSVWSYKLCSSGVEVKSITLQPGAKLTLNLELKVGLETGVYTVNISVAESEGYNYTQGIVVEVSLEGVNVLEALNVFMEARPGNIVSYSFKLTNPFSVGIIYNLTVIKDVDWTTILKAEGVEVSQVYLKPESSIQLTLEIYVPYTVPEGDYKFVVKAVSEVASGYAEVSLRVKKGVPILFLETSTPSIDAASGDTAVYSIKVSNKGTRDAEINFTIVGLPEEFKWSIKDAQGNTISRIFLKAGGSSTIRLAIKVPPGYKPQYIAFTFKALADNSTAELKLGLNVLGKYEIDYYTENFYIEGYVGDTLTFGLEVVNTGYNDLTEVKVVLIKVPQDFNVTVEPDVVSVLKPGEKTIFTIKIETPSDANAGDYYVFLKAVSNEDEAPQVSLHIFLKQRTETTLLAVAAVAAVVVALIIVYWKYGRR